MEKRAGSPAKQCRPTVIGYPFTDEVMNHHYPIDLRVPGNKGYNGKTDPKEHINSYYGNMLMIGVSDAVICRAFYATLKGRAAEWFNTLE